MRGQVKREVSQEDFEKLLKDNPDLEELKSGVYIRREQASQYTTWKRPIAAKIGGKFYVMRPA
jgi:hypothetical protein